MFLIIQSELAEITECTGVYEVGTGFIDVFAKESFEEYNDRLGKITLDICLMPKN